MTIAVAQNHVSPELELHEIPIGKLVESPWNPRKHFNDEKLKQLAENIRAVGQLSPLVVRPTRDTKGVFGAYEIGAGHRRYRALRLGGAKTALCRVVDMDDVQFTELLNIENLQRDDIHPLEEAQGFRDLMERAGYDVAKIAARCGRSEKYVYDRLKLLQLTPEAKKLFLAGEFEAGHAIILARLKPEQQKRAIAKDDGGNYSRRAGLFQDEFVDPDPNLPAQEQLKFDHRMKAVSVREFQTFVDNTFRMKPEEVDGFLFPDTALLVAQAKEDEIKVVHITHDYRVPDPARDEKERTYGEQAWKHAGGRKGKECDYAVLGVVVAGPGRGDAFMVCVRKDKCKQHWATEQKELERRRKANARQAGSSSASSRDTSYERQQAKYEAERKARDAERARWKAAMPKLYAALAEKLKATPVTPTSRIGEELRQAAEEWITKAARQHCQPGRTLDDLVRYFVFASIDEQAFGSYDAESEIPRALKAWGIDARKLVDEVSPKVQTSAKPTKKAKAK